MLSSPLKPSAEQYEQASYWVSLLNDRDCSPQRQQEFQAWMNWDSLNQQAYKEVEAYWQQLDGLESLAQVQIKAARAVIKQKPIQRHGMPRQSLAIAALVLLMVITVPFARVYLDNGSYQTTKGERLSIQLSDGSRIDLNTDTQVQVSYSLFVRRVNLAKGEALFTIQHDAEKAFEVTAAQGLIRDIGTQFDVYRQGDKVSVSVLEGKVSVSNLQATTPQMLTARMQYTYGKEGQNLLVNNGDLTDIASWREGKIIFKGQRLDVVLEQLSRYHDVKLSADSAKLAALKVSGSFPTTNLNLALNTIAASLPVTINRLGTDRIALIASGKEN